MSEEIKSGQAEMKPTVSAIQSELEDINHKTQNLHKELTDKIEKHRWNYRQQRCPSTRRQGSSR
jgi:hypothetical protein